MKSLLLADRKSLSSKRLCGMLGWAVILLIVIYCTIAVVEAPMSAEVIAYTSAGLLGMDSIASIFRRHGEV